MVYGCYNIVKCTEHLIFDVFLPKIGRFLPKITEPANIQVREKTEVPTSLSIPLRRGIRGGLGGLTAANDQVPNRYSGYYGNL